MTDKIISLDVLYKTFSKKFSEEITTEFKKYKSEHSNHELHKINSDFYLLKYNEIEDSIKFYKTIYQMNVFKFYPTK